MRSEIQESLILNLKNEGVRMNSTILMLKITDTTNFINKYKEKSVCIINKLYHIFHTLGLIYQGDVCTGRDMILWKEDRESINNKSKLYVYKLLITTTQNKSSSKSKSQNKNETKDELSPDNQYSNVNNTKFIYSKENILNISFICAKKILYTFYNKFPKIMKMLYDSDVRLNFFLNYGEIFNGYIGKDKIDEVFTGINILESEQILKKLNSFYNMPSIFLHNTFLLGLDEKLTDLTFPCDIVKINDKNDVVKIIRIHKVHFESPELLDTDKDENLTTVVKKEIYEKRKKKLEDILKYEKFEEYIPNDDVIEIYYMNNYHTEYFKYLKKLFDNYQYNKLKDCFVDLRRIKKNEDFKMLKDESFKSRLKILEDLIKNKFDDKDKNKLDVNFTFSIYN